MSTCRLPSRLYLDVTNACPLRCLHCCSSSGEPFARELTGEELLGIVDQCHAMGVKNLVISGGEPMLREDLMDILARAGALGLGVTLLTSGVLMTEEAAACLARQGVRVKISLDGVKASSHDSLRGNGAFRAALKALELLQSSGLKALSVHFTVHRGNFTEMTELPGLLSRLAVRNIVVGTIKPSGRAAAHGELLIPPAMIPYLKQKIRDLSDHGGLHLENFTDRGWDGFGCPAKCSKFGINAYGKATTCAFFSTEFLGGSVRESSLMELWEQYQARSGMFVPSKQCASCPALADSGGGCRARAYYYSGDINGPDPHCCALYEKMRFIEAHRPLVLEAARDAWAAFMGLRCEV
ncbi:MAG: radical SAM protein [Candidatus Eremiobacteraeota bacterium]|nr:radical SAM protein [Candidatus Eremiobacteraeota bacterium]